MKPSDPVLTLRGLTAGYGRMDIVRDVDLSVGRGESVGLVGRNGAGKTTLISAVAGLIQGVRGVVRLGEQDIVSMPAHDRVAAGMALVPSGGRLFRSLTVQENLTIGVPRAEASTCDPAYELFPELRSLRDRYAGGLSGGERQMVAIGRALILRPRLLLLDEPSEGLAPLVVMRLADALRVLREQGMAMLLAEQNVRFSELVTTRAYRIEKGRVEEVAVHV